MFDTVPEFKPWPKIARLNREVVITEKIDGTNAAIHIHDGHAYAQSRTRMLGPGADNFGFYAWVKRNEEALVNALGEGIHFGEWWGVGIQRGYDTSQRTFSLFNTSKWYAPEEEGGDVETGLHPAIVLLQEQGVAIDVVPVLYAGPWMNPVTGLYAPYEALAFLKAHGSCLRGARDWSDPEGIVVYHTASGTMFKATCKNDEKPKGQ